MEAARAKQGPALLTLDALRRCFEQAIDFGDAQHLRQGALFLGAAETGGRIDGDRVVAGEKLVELANGREPPRPRRRREAVGRHRREIRLHVATVGGERAGAALIEKRQVVVEVAGVGVARVFGGAALGRHHLEKLAEPRRRCLIAPAHLGPLRLPAAVGARPFDE